MSAIEDGVRARFEKTLVNEKGLEAELAQAVRTELEQEKGPNPERLADLFRKHSER